MGKMGYNLLSMYQHDVNMSFISFFFRKLLYETRFVVVGRVEALRSGPTWWSLIARPWF